MLRKYPTTFASTSPGRFDNSKTKQGWSEEFFWPEREPDSAKGTQAASPSDNERPRSARVDSTKQPEHRVKALAHNAHCVETGRAGSAQSLRIPRRNRARVWT